MLKQIAKEIQQYQGKCYIVGGYVRDHILGIPSKDIDVEVYRMTPKMLENIISRYGKVTYCGKSFGVYKLNNMDFSFPRRERKNGVGYKGFDIKIDPFMDPREACIRRDITINALMMDPITNEIIDYIDGRKDLEKKIIRAVSERFKEDPLRVYRVAQFSARFQFEIDFLTENMCLQLINELETLSKERIFVEFEKILLKAEKPSIAFKFLDQIGVLEKYFPELYNMKGIHQGSVHHNEDVACHTMMALDSIPMEERDLPLMLATLCHDMGKTVVENIVEDDHVHFYGHDQEGIKVAESFLRRITDETNLISEVLNLVEYHMRPYEIKSNLTKRLMRRLALKTNIEKLMKLHKADILGRNLKQEKDYSHIEKFLDMYGEIKNEIKPLIQGRDLINIGLKPGNYFGPILKKLFEMQLNEEFSTVEDGIRIAKEKDLI